MEQPNHAIVDAALDIARTRHGHGGNGQGEPRGVLERCDTVGEIGDFIRFQCTECSERITVTGKEAAAQAAALRSPPSPVSPSSIYDDAMVRGLARAAAFLEQHSPLRAGGDLWDDECREALAMARRLGIVGGRRAAQDVHADDPDRMAFGLVEFFKDMARSPASSLPEQLAVAAASASASAPVPAADLPAKVIVETCARAAYEANRAYCLAIGDTSQPAWDDAPDWQRSSTRNGVAGALAGATPEQIHEAWLEEKRATGWKYGPVKNPDAKEHPCFGPYDQLPPNQRAKDDLFLAVVRAVAAATGRVRVTRIAVRTDDPDGLVAQLAAEMKGRA